MDPNYGYQSVTPSSSWNMIWTQSFGALGDGESIFQGIYTTSGWWFGTLFIFPEYMGIIIPTELDIVYIILWFYHNIWWFYPTD
jgi:hypothetical protein